MHFHGRSEILDRLYNSLMKPELDPVHYDIRALSREILLRHDANQSGCGDIGLGPDIGQSRDA